MVVGLRVSVVLIVPLTEWYCESVCIKLKSFDVYKGKLNFG